jgi:hypothetical protein
VDVGENLALALRILLHFVLSQAEVDALGDVEVDFVADVGDDFCGAGDIIDLFALKGC